MKGEMEYVLEEQSVFHAFEARLLTDAELESELEAAGLRRRRVLDERGAWSEAVLARR